LDISVIVITYNSADVVRGCLDALARSQFTGTCEVIVVDNASRDNTVQIVRSEYPSVTLVVEHENLGYSRGVNSGIRYASGRYFLILNPDTEVQPDALKMLCEFSDAHDDAAIVGPRLLFRDGSVQYSCRRFYTLRVLVMRRTPIGKLFPKSRAVREHLMEDFDHASTRPVDWVLGAAMFVRRDAVESVGMMDERFFLYFEDVDWCYRMKQNGLRVYYHADAVVTHGYKRQSAQSVVNRSFVAHLASLMRYYEKWNTVVYGIKRHREVVKLLLFLGIDLVAFNAAFQSAYWLRAALNSVFPNPIFPLADYTRFVVFLNLLFVFVFGALGLYRIRRETRFSDELFHIMRAVFFASVLLMTSTYLGQIRTYSRMVVVFVMGFAVVYTWILRSIVRAVHRRLLAHKVDLRPACVIGPRAVARKLAADVGRIARMGIEVVGIIDPTDGVPGVLGIDAVESMIGRYRAQQIIVFSDSVDDESLALLVAIGKRRVVDVTVVTGHAALVQRSAVVEEFGGRSVISYPRRARHALDHVGRRLLDVFGGACFCMVSVPVCVVYWLRARSRGRRPFTVVQRIGCEGEPVTISVAGDAESSRGPSDFVNSSLFWHVFVGHLSLVGPVALSGADTERLGEFSRLRLGVRPGVTGYWRLADGDTVNRADLIAQDAAYLRDGSVLENLRVLTITLPRMLAGHRRFVRLAPADSLPPGKQVL